MRDSVPSARYSPVCNVLRLPSFVMYCPFYCIYGESGSSILIESTDSVIVNILIFFFVELKDEKKWKKLMEVDQEDQETLEKTL